MVIYLLDSRLFWIDSATKCEISDHLLTCFLQFQGRSYSSSRQDHFAEEFQPMYSVLLSLHFCKIGWISRAIVKAIICSEILNFSTRLVLHQNLLVFKCFESLVFAFQHSQPNFSWMVINHRIKYLESPREALEGPHKCEWM